MLIAPNTRWKNKGYSPSPETAKKIADYFGITVKELTDVEQKEKPAINNDDRLSEMKSILIEQVKQLDSGTSGKPSDIKRFVTLC